MLKNSSITSNHQISKSFWAHPYCGVPLLGMVLYPRSPQWLFSCLGALSVLLVLMPLSVKGGGGVYIKNGNFFITYADIKFSQSRLERTYNSRSTFKGMFGVGWGSELESYLDVQGDGTVLLHQRGSGGTSILRPPVLSKDDIRASVDRIMLAAEHDGRFRDDTEYHEKRQELLRNAEHRRLWWSYYVKKGKLEPRRIKPGTVYRGQKWGEQQRLLRTHDGYQLTNQPSDRVREFDTSGRLTAVRKLHEGNAEILHIVRDRMGHISKVADQNGQQWSFHMNDNGTVARIDTPNGKSSHYNYADRYLIGSIDIAGNRYSYRYDRKSNLTAIGYADNSRQIITYTGTEHDDKSMHMARSVTKRMGLQPGTTMMKNTTEQTGKNITLLKLPIIIPTAILSSSMNSGACACGMVLFIPSVNGSRRTAI